MLATCGSWGFIPRVLFVSDGVAASIEAGWRKKNQVRWATAPSVEEWQRRIRPRLKEGDLKGFEQVRGRIARNLTYSMIQSGRDRLARETVEAYGQAFPPDRVSLILQRAHRFGGLGWKMACMALRLREHGRATTMWLKRSRGHSAVQATVSEPAEGGAKLNM